MLSLFKEFDIHFFLNLKIGQIFKKNCQKPVSNNLA